MPEMDSAEVERAELGSSWPRGPGARCLAPSARGPDLRLASATLIH